MPDQQPEPARGAPWRELLQAIVSSIVLGAVFYVVLGYAFRLESLAAIPYADSIRIGLSVFAGSFFFVVNFRDFRERARARAMTARVDEALKQSVGSAEAGPASVSASDVASQVGGAGADKEEVERLVEQRKQRLLVDKKNLTPELTYLVDNWHPLPRDVKRGLNRFYLSYLVAYNRGLLTSEPVVSGHQLAKWLVLSEKWPQLGRGLAGSPERMEKLEEKARLATHSAMSDPFRDELRALAPLYVDDKDLLDFIISLPQLRAVLPRLVQYGAAQPVQKTGQVVPPPTIPQAPSAPPA